MTDGVSATVNVERTDAGVVVVARTAARTVRLHLEIPEARQLQLDIRRVLANPGDESPRMVALRLANETRSGQRALKEAVSGGRLQVAAALVDPRAARLPVMSLLTCVPGCGPATAARIMRRCQIAETGRQGRRRIGELTDRQRSELCDWFATWDRENAA